MTNIFPYLLGLTPKPVRPYLELIRFEKVCLLAPSGFCIILIRLISLRGQHSCSGLLVRNTLFNKHQLLNLLSLLRSLGTYSCGISFSDAIINIC